MLDEVIQFIFDHTTAYLKRQPRLTISDPLTLGKLAKDGESGASALESVGLSLINIEEERVNRAVAQTRVISDHGTTTMNPEIRLVLYLMFTASFSEYKTNLRYLDGILNLFQSSNVFTPREFPDLDPKIKKLIVDLYSLDFEQQNHLWGYLGGKYTPSLIYRVRLVTIQANAVRSEGSRVSRGTITGRDSSQ